MATDEEKDPARQKDLPQPAFGEKSGEQGAILDQDGRPMGPDRPGQEVQNQPPDQNARTVGKQGG